MTEDIIEFWESQDGHAVDLQYRPEQSASRPIKIGLVDDDNNEMVVQLSNEDWTKLIGVITEFTSKTLAVREKELEGDGT